MPTFSVVTFGCKVSQYESQALRERLERRGLVEAPAGAAPDVVLVHTCTVTEAASRDAEREVRRTHLAHPFAEISVTGCAAESHREVFLGLPGVRRVAGPGEHASLFADPRLSPADTALSISRFDGHTRAFLKVQDGCDLRCSFCIIPRVRGAPASRPPAAALEEARRLVDHGHREIVLTGIHLGAYGKDLGGGASLAGLAEALLRLPGLLRLRLSSIEANEIDGRLIDLMAAEPRLCPHLHVPLQSGDDGVLASMRRRYGTARFLETLAAVADRVPDPAFTTDVIAGFPGETDAQFERTLDVCRRAGFSKIHVFPYSRRRGTDAALRPDLPARVKKERARRLDRLGAELAEAYARRFVGREVEVLMERGGTGHTERHLRVRADAPANHVLRSRVAGLRDGFLTLETA